MNLQQLHYFQKISECQQYTLAAQELHVTQATLSYAILNLERELNVKLFDRKGKSVLLTECGKAYLSCVRDALQALDRGEQMVKNLSMPGQAQNQADLSGVPEASGLRHALRPVRRGERAAAPL